MNIIPPVSSAGLIGCEGISTGLELGGVTPPASPPCPGLVLGAPENRFAHSLGAGAACGGDDRGVVACCAGGDATSEGAALDGVELTPLVMTGSL